MYCLLCLLICSLVATEDWKSKPVRIALVFNGGSLGILIGSVIVLVLQTVYTLNSQCVRNTTPFSEYSIVGCYLHFPCFCFRFQ